MQTIFMKKKNIFADDAGSPLMSIINDKKTLLSAINLNQIKNYDKVIVPQRDDYVTCCEFKDCLHPNGDANRNKNGSYRKGKTFKVSEKMNLGSTYGIYGYTGKGTNREGVYLEAVRMATPEEIEQCKKRF